MKATVIQRNIHISSRKAVLVCDLIRNKNVVDALKILNYTNKKIAPIIHKLLNQCIANATNNHAMNAEKLYIYHIVANQGHTLKRTSPRARGSADLIRKRHSHIEIVLSDDIDERKKDLEKIKLIQRNKALKNKGHHSKQLLENKKKLDNQNLVIAKNKKLESLKKPIIKSVVTKSKTISISKESNKTEKDKIKKVNISQENLIANKATTKKDSLVKKPAIKKVDQDKFKNEAPLINKKVPIDKVIKQKTSIQTKKPNSKIVKKETK